MTLVLLLAGLWSTDPRLPVACLTVHASGAWSVSYSLSRPLGCTPGDFAGDGCVGVPLVCVCGDHGPLFPHVVLEGPPGEVSAFKDTLWEGTPVRWGVLLEKVDAESARIRIQGVVGFPCSGQVIDEVWLAYREGSLTPSRETTWGAIKARWSPGPIR